MLGSFLEKGALRHETHPALEAGEELVASEVTQDPADEAPVNVGREKVAGSSPRLQHHHGHTSASMDPVEGLPWPETMASPAGDGTHYSIMEETLSPDITL